MKGHLCILEIPSNLEFVIVVFQWPSTSTTIYPDKTNMLIRYH